MWLQTGHFPIAFVHENIVGGYDMTYLQDDVILLREFQSY